MIVENKQMADKLNNFFTSVFTKENTSNIPPKNQESTCGMDKIIITQDKIRRKIQELRLDSAAGPNGITPRLLKNLGHSILQPLELVYTKSLRDGTVPFGKWP